MKQKILLVTLSFIGVVFYANTALAGSATVTWNANTEPDLAGYKIYYGTGQRTGTDPKVCGLCGYANTVTVGNVITYTFNNLTDGATYYFSVSALDTSGNESSFSTQASKSLLTVDATAPAVSVTAPSAGTVSGTITFSANASDPAVAGAVTSGLFQVTLLVDGSVFATANTGSISRSLDTGTLTNGSHTLTASARDNAGNIANSGVVNVTVSNQAATKYPRTVSLTSLEGRGSVPAGTLITATVLSPASGSVLETQTDLAPNASSNYTVTFLSSDPQLVNVRVKVDGYLSRLLSNIDTTQNTVAALAVPQFLAGDSNNDNTINSLDYSQMNGHWLQNFPSSDINRDNLVNSLDFAVLKNNWNSPANNINFQVKAFKAIIIKAQPKNSAPEIALKRFYKTKFLSEPYLKYSALSARRLP